MSEGNKRIAAVVVTYNRKKLLGECLTSVVNQSVPPDAIYIVDNASTDGTPEYLIESNYIIQVAVPHEMAFEVEKKHEVPSGKQIEIHYIRMHENTGGAGGFYEGIKRAYRAGYDWLWLMDDDGLAGGDTLKIFSSLNPDHESCYCPLVLDPLNTGLLTFGVQGFWEKEKLYFHSLSDVNNFIDARNTSIINGFGNFYNGIFLSKTIVKEAGFPRREMYIWGDENEYLFRILGKGFKIKIMLKNVFFHPRFPKRSIRFLGKTITYIDNPVTWKYYFHARNLLYINNKYRRILNVKWPVLKCLVSELILAIYLGKMRKAILWGLIDHLFGRPYKSVEELTK